MKLVEGVQELYRRLRRGEGWTGPNIVEDEEGYPLVQDLLESLTVLAPNQRRRTEKDLDEDGNAEQDEDDEDDNVKQRSPHDDNVGRVSSTSPPSTPMNRGQFPASSCSASEQLGPKHNTTHMSLFLEPEALQPDNMMSGLNQPGPLFRQQPLPTSEQGLWATAPMYDSSGTFLSFPGFADPFPDHQVDCSWYQDGYIT